MRNTGKSFRAIMISLYHLSLGENVIYVTDHPNYIFKLCRNMIKDFNGFNCILHRREISINRNKLKFVSLIEIENTSRYKGINFIMVEDLSCLEGKRK